MAAEAITRSIRVLLGKPSAEPGIVVCVHSFGNLLNFDSHLHVMATDGGFTPDGAFHSLPTMSLAPIEGFFRQRMFKMLLRKGFLTPERIKLMKSWEHSGFNVNAAVRIGADASGRENLARYLTRAPFSMNKIRYDPAARTVIYKIKMVAGPTRAGQAAANSGIHISTSGPQNTSSSTHSISAVGWRTNSSTAARIASSGRPRLPPGRHEARGRRGPARRAGARDIFPAERCRVAAIDSGPARCENEQVKPITTRRAQ